MAEGLLFPTFRAFDPTQGVYRHERNSERVDYHPPLANTRRAVKRTKIVRKGLRGAGPGTNKSAPLDTLRASYARRTGAQVVDTSTKPGRSTEKRLTGSAGNAFTTSRVSPTSGWVITDTRTPAQRIADALGETKKVDLWQDALDEWRYGHR